MQNSPNSDGVLTVRAASMREALLKVRHQLGPDALILEQKKKGTGVEVKASLDVSEDIVEIDQPVAEEKPVPEKAPPAAPMQTFPLRLAEHLVCAQKPLSALRGKLRFIGPSGVGKTSLLIKILVEWVMHNGVANVLVVSTDSQKLAAAEPLQLACQLLGVSLRESTPARLGELLRKHADAELILIDSCASELEGTGVLNEVQEVVVLSALHSLYSLERQLSVMPDLAQAWVALTHVDQPFDRQALFHWMDERALRLFCMGSSAYLPGGVEAVTRAVLQRLLHPPVH